MSFFTFILLIVAAGLGYELLRQRNLTHVGRWEDRDGRSHPISDSNASDRAAELAKELEREVTELRERVKVLERIATEDREAKRLSSEIDRLRDE